MDDLDDLVRRGLAKWPDVPDCYGWLALDGRGRWRIGDERQAITHAATIAFLNRNYFADAEGHWVVQNGPQKVFVELDFAPFVWRITEQADQDLALTDHRGQTATAIERVWLADNGRFYLLADGRPGVVHDHDAALMIDRLCDAQGAALSDETLEALAVRLEAEPENESNASSAPSARTKLPDGVNDLCLRLAGYPAPLSIQQASAQDMEQILGYRAHPIQRPFGLA